MNIKNKCITYFKISGDFEPEKIIEILDIIPSKVIKKGEKYMMLNKERQHHYSILKFGYNDEYNVLVDEMIEKTIKELRTKIKELKDLKISYPDIAYTLEVVPEITLGSDEPNPYLSPTKEIMKFLVEIDAEYDIDYYSYSENFYWSGRVFYEILINDKHAGYEEVIQLIKGIPDDPLQQLENIAKKKEISYVSKIGEQVEIKLFKVKDIYAIHNQDFEEAFEVYSNIMPATNDELTKYLNIAYNLNENETRELNVFEGSRTDEERR